jgi:two-component system sensor histidine kinase YesM
VLYKGKSHLFNFLFKRTIAVIICSILIVTIPMFSMLAVYSKEEIAKYNNETILLINQELDSFFHSLDNIESTLISNNEFRIALTLNETLPHYDDSYTVNAFQSADQSIRNLIMFQDGLQYCAVGLEGHLPIRYSYENVNGNYVPSSSSWYAEVSKDPFLGHIIFNNHRDYYTSADNAISMIRAITNVKTGKPIGFFIIDITYPNFRSMIANKINSSLPIEIQDPSGQILYSNVNSNFPPGTINAANKFPLTSAYTGLTVTTYTTNQLFMYRIGKIILVVSVIMALYLLVIFAVSLRSTRRFINPIYSLMKDMKQVVRGNFDVTANYTGSIIEIHDLYLSFNRLVFGMRDLLKTNYETNLLKTQAELNALQEKINPHFLYNTLETISSQAIIDGSKAASIMCQKLGALFAYNLQERNMVTLDQEIKQSKDFLYISENCVYYKNIHVNYDIQPDTLDGVIPKMTLQPILENCFKHGFKQVRDKQPNIQIKTHSDGAFIVIEIKDNGQGMTAQQLSQLKEGLRRRLHIPRHPQHARIGLSHIHTRLSLHYGPEYSIDIHSQINEGTSILLYIPKYQSSKEILDV